MAYQQLPAVVAALAQAVGSRRPVPPLTEAWPRLTVDDAYEVQLAGVRSRLDGGASVVGHKVGLTSRAMQEMLGIDEPDYGHLLSDMAIPDGGTVRADRFLSPRAEIELAFVLSRPLVGPDVTEADVLTATASVHPAIEIIDSRIADWRIDLVDTIADNASSGGFVLGSGADPGPLDLAAVEGTLSHNGVVVERGTGAAVLGHPARAVAWLANALTRRGVSLEAGHVVLSGACTRAVPVTAGDTVAGEFAGLGTVSVSFG